MRRRAPKRALIAVLVLSSLFFLSLNLTGKWDAGWLYGVFLTITGPPQKALSWAEKKVEDLFYSYLYLVNLREENRRLKEALKRLTYERNLLLEQVEELKRLRQLLKFKERTKLRMVPAEVVALSPEPHIRTLVIDKGSTDGLKEGMPVVAWEGVVGRILHVGQRTSMVLPIVERGSAVSVLLRSSRTRAILEGEGKGCRLVYIPRDKEVREGEGVITSGLDGIYPKGLPVGRVVKVTRRSRRFFLEVEVAPAVDFGKLEEVMVLVGG